MVSRRQFLAKGAGVAFATAASAAASPAGAHDLDAQLKRGVGVSSWSGAPYKQVATVCTACPARCPALAYVDDGRLAKIEGQPQSIRTSGHLCAKGQASVEQVLDPDRVVHPLRRAGARGEGKWRRVGWDEALADLAVRLKTLKDAGAPERLMVIHGWLSAGAERLLKEVFLAAYGSASVVGPETMGRSARRLAHQLTWGGAADSPDLRNARFILNFGSNFLEAHTNHVPLAHSYVDGLMEHGARMVTFDVRLSNTAARSDEWVPVRPGTDLAVVLALCHVVIEEGLYRGEGERFLAYCKVAPSWNGSVTEKVAALTAHLASYTPEWAETISGVRASKIREIARAFATAKPACIVSQRGVVAHHNGVETERAIQMLAAITGNIDNPGGRCQAVVGRWMTPKVAADKVPQPKRLAALDGRSAALPIDGVGHLALTRIKETGAGPAVLIWYAHNPVYAGGDVKETAAILKDERLLPFTVAVTPFYDESAALADLVLPDALGLESFDLEEGVSPTQVDEYALRQPVIEPMGEARDFKDVLLDLGARLGLSLPVRTAAKFVEEACRLTPPIRSKARGFAGMRRAGVWSDKEATPAYFTYRAPVPPEEERKEGVILDDATGVYWNWRAAGLASEAEARAKGYVGTPQATRAYVGQAVGKSVVLGFRPDLLPKSGLFEIYSDVLAKQGLPALPSWMPIPAHQAMKPGELVLTTFKVNVHTNGRTQNCRWLQEIVHRTPAWINRATAKSHGIRDGDRVRLSSRAGEVVTTARVTQAVAPGVVALAAHGGRWEYGRYASGKRSPVGVDDARIARNPKWWKENGVHAGWIIAKGADPLAGQQPWMDTVVTIAKA